MAVNYAAYEQQRRNIESDYSAKQASGDYGRFVAQQRGATRVGDLAKGFRKGWGQNATQWGSRGQTGGNVRSGFYQKAMQTYLGDFQQSQNSLNQELANEQHGFDLQSTQWAAERQRALAQLELQKQQEIAQLAQNIQAVRPLV